MAIDKTSLNSIGPLAGQLKSNLSSIEKTQMAAVKNIGSSLTSNPGVINGDVSGTISRATNSQKSMLELGTTLAAKLNGAGAIPKTSSDALIPAVVNSVQEKTKLPGLFPKNPVDMNIASNRVPDPYKTSPQERIKKKKERLLGREDYRYDGLDYPPDLKQNAAAHLELQFHRYERPSPTESGKTALDETVRLPIPEAFNVSHGIRYEERDTGVLGEMAQTTAGQSLAAGMRSMRDGKEVDAGQLISSMGENFKEDAANVLKSAAFLKLVDSEPVLGGIAGQMAGTIPNPHPSVFFKGLDLREFDWSWKFVPRSAEEAAVLDKVLRYIKEKILPVNANTFIDYPHLVQPVVMPEDGLWGKFKKCAVKNFSINFSDEGTSAFFQNGKPVSIRCNMRIQEVEMFVSRTEGGS